MKRAMAFVAVAGCIVAALGCGGMPGGGGGGGGGGYIPDAYTPYMYNTDLSDYKVGNWVHYKMDMAGNSSESWIKVVGKDGDNLWVQVGMSATGDHLMLVQPDRKVVKAYFSGKDDKDWKEAKITEMPTGTGEVPKDCPGCKKPVADHKKPEMNWTDENAKAADKDLACKKCAMKMWDCEGKEMTGTSWFCKDVPKLQAGGGEHGGMVGSEMMGMKTWLVGFGSDAQPKHPIPAPK